MTRSTCSATFRLRPARTGLWAEMLDDRKFYLADRGAAVACASGSRPFRTATLGARRPGRRHHDGP